MPDKRERLFSRSYAIPFSLLTLLLVGLLLLWIVRLRIDDLHANLATVAQGAVAGVASEIQHFVKEQRRLVGLFARRQESLLQSVASEPDNAGLQAELRARVGEFFPEYLAYTLTDWARRPVLDSAEGYLGDPCLEDLSAFYDQRFPALRVHATALGRHLDIAVAWGKDGREGMFFVSFPLEVIARQLKDGQPHGYQLLLLRQDAPDSIEINAAGSRDALYDPAQNKLGEAQKKWVEYTFTLQGTQWQLAAVYSEALFNLQEAAIWDQTLIIFLLFAALNLLMALFTRHTERKGRRAEQAMIASEARYRAIVQDQTELICRYLPDATLSFVNEAYARYFGKPLEALLGRPFTDLLPAAQQEEVRAHVASLFAEPRISTHERALITPEGETRWQHWMERPIYDERGQVVEIQAVGRDITERKAAENAVQDSRERLGLVLEGSNLGFWDWDLPHGTIKCNARLYTMLGYAPDEFEMTPRIWKNWIHPGERRTVLILLKAHLRGYMPTLEREYRVRSKTGEWKWLLTSGKVVARDAAGKPTRLAGTHADITSRKYTEKTLREREARLKAIFDNASVGIGLGGADGRFVQANGRLIEMFGYSWRELLQRNYLDLTHPEDQAEARRRFDDLLHDRVKACRTEYRYLRKDGGVFWGSLWLSKILDEEGNLQAILGILIDLTERKEVELALHAAKETAEAATQAKSAFLANMSHELRTPMNGVMGMAELLLNTDLNERQREYAMTIRSSGDALLTLLNDILDFSKIEAGKLVLEPVPVDLESIILDVVRLLGYYAEKKGLELLVRYAPKVPRGVKADPGRVRQVFTNLIGNAIKFTERGHVLVDVECLEETKQRVVLQIRIEDTGIGIPESQLQNIFDKFTQADSSTTRRFGGTGLGLAISRQLVEMMHGQIGVSSRQGEGSVFSVTLPLPRAALPSLDNAWQPRKSIATTRILVVDDNSLNRQILVEQIGSLEAVCDAVSDAQAALDTLREAAALGRPYWLVIVDYLMPDTDGLRLAERIRAVPELHSVCLVLLSSALYPRNHQELSGRGFSTCLLKPLPYQYLHYALEVLRAVYERDGTPPEWLELDARLAGREAETGEAGDTPLAAGARVLLVEDNEINRIVAINMLEKLGCQLDIAVDGAQAVKAVERQTYAMIFMDLQMPEMDGLEATRQIRRREAGVRHTPIVAMTANAMQSDADACFAAGMDEYIAKPFTLAQVQAALEKYLARPDAEAAPPAPLQPPPPDAAARPPVFEAPQLRRVVLGNVGLLKQVLGLFAEDTAQQLAKLDALLAAEDVSGQQKTLERVLHSIKGEARNVGAMRLGEVAFDGEQAAKQADFARVREFAPALHAAFQELQAVWREIDWDNFLNT